jgi:hypothetical protein
VKSSVFYDVTPYIPVKIYQSCGGTYFLPFQVSSRSTQFAALAAYILLVFCFA